LLVTTQLTTKYCSKTQLTTTFIKKYTLSLINVVVNVFLLQDFGTESGTGLG